MVNAKWIKSENSECCMVNFNYKNKPYRFEIRKNGEFDLVTDLRPNWQGNDLVCDFCLEKHSSSCKAILTDYDHTYEIIKKVVNSTEIRLNLLLETKLDLDNVFIGIDVKGKYIDVKKAKENLQKLSAFSKKNGHKITEFYADLTGYITEIKKNAEENVPSNQLVYLVDYSEHNYLNFTLVEQVKIEEGTCTKTNILYKNIREKNRIKIEELNEVISACVHSLGMESGCFDDRIREEKWRIKLLNKQYKRIPDWRKTEEALHFEKDLDEKTDDFYDLLCYLESDAYSDLDFFEQQITDYYYKETIEKE